MSSTLKLDSFRTRGGSFSLVGMDVISNKPKSTITRGRTSCVMIAFLSRLEFKNLFMNIALYWRHFNFMPVSSSNKTKFQNKSENYSHCCPIVCLSVCLSVCQSIRLSVYLNNSVFPSKSYRLIVDPRKFDVLKRNIYPKSKALRANILVFRTSNFQGAAIRPIVTTYGLHSFLYLDA